MTLIDIKTSALGVALKTYVLPVEIEKEEVLIEEKGAIPRAIEKKATVIPASTIAVTV